MPPVTRSSHSRIAPAPLQQTFPNRRKSVRPAKATPSLQKRQSTLTQIDYVTPPSGQREHVLDFSDADDDEDDYEEQRPRKKRRRNASKGSTKVKTAGKTQKSTNRTNRSQSTLTQKWSGRPSIPIASDSEEDDDDFAMLEADAFEMHDLHGRGGSPNVPRRSMSLEHSPKTDLASRIYREESTRLTTADPATRSSTPFGANEAVIPSSQTPASVHASMENEANARVQQRSPLRERSSNAMPPKEARPADCIDSRAADVDPGSGKLLSNSKDNETQAMGTWMANVIMTPKKPRTAERRGFVRTTTVQDSEEDDSAFEMSPVAKAAGVDTLDFAKQTPSAEAQIVDDVRESEKHSSREVAPTLTTNRDSDSAPAAVASQEPLWKRTGLVADSEEGSMELDAMNLPDTEQQITNDNVNDSVDQEPEVQEKEIVDTDYEADNEHAGHYTDAEGIASDFDYEEVYPQTYDPVSAALDRDAARFGMTETQLDAEQRNDANDDDYDEDDLDAGMDRRADHSAEDEVVEVVPSSQPLERKVPSSPELGEAESMRNETKQDVNRPTGDVDDSGYGSQASVIPSSQPGDVNGRASQEPLTWSEPREEQLSKANAQMQSRHDQSFKATSKPMQPPERDQQSLPAPLRPSQVSTIGDTQPSRPNSAHGVPLTFTTPQKSARTWDLSSSPLPMPPESWCSGVDTIEEEPQLGSDGLADFSLPPPPPLLLSSSMRQSGSDE